MNLLPAAFSWPWWALLAAVPVGIVLLYFLKLRRQPLQVPSTFLWARTIEDLHVNSLLQRLRKNLLLLLQLLVVAMAILALLRPGWQGEQSTGQRQVILLDTSASMAASDVTGQPTRLDQARRLAEQRIDAMRDSDVAMLIAFSDRADVLQSFTSDRRRLREALARATQTNRPTDLLEALRAADGLANPNRTSQAGDVNDVQVADAQPADLVIFSDGGFQAVTEFDLGNLTPTYIPIGSASPSNLAILAFSAERDGERPDQVQAFARVANLGGEAAEGSATLLMDGQFLDAAAIDLAAGEETGLSFQLEAPQAAELQLQLDMTDDLAADNVAFAAIPPLRTVSVLLVTPANQPLELALQTLQAAKVSVLETVDPSYLTTEAYQQRAAAARDDLIIYDRCRPPQMPPANTMFIGTIPPADWEAGPMQSPVLLIDIDRTHPLMHYLELFSLQIVEGRALTPPRGATDLLTADSGAVMSVAPRDGYQDLVVGFEVLSTREDGGSAFNTDWPVQRSWPVFILNVLRHLGGAAEVGAAASHRPGETVTIRVDNALRQIKLAPPTGATRTIPVGPGGVASIADTEQTGLYRVTSGDTPLDLFAVNLFDRRESRLQPAPSVQIGYRPVEGAAAVVQGRSEIWRWLLLAAVGLLTTEWLIYARRLM